MHGASKAGGAVVGVLADSLERTALAHDNREPLMGRRLVLVSPYDPAAGFNVGHAMSRNKLIYAMADAAVVVNSDFEKGGTWAGAIEQLERLRFVPVFVRNGPDAGKGNSALLRRGARPWPDPHDGAEMVEVLAAVTEAAESRQETIPFDLVAEAPTPLAEESPQAAETGGRYHQASRVDVALPPAEQLLCTVRDILSRELVEAHTDAEVAHLLAVSEPQAKMWLSALVGQGVLEQLAGPTRYRATRNLSQSRAELVPLRHSGSVPVGRPRPARSRSARPAEPSGAGAGSTGWDRADRPRTGPT